MRVGTSRLVLTATVIVAGLAATSAADSANIACPANKVLPELDANYHECSHGFENGSCQRFVQLLKTLLPKFDCQRSFDTSPVPAVWLANDAAFEDYVNLLSRLKDKDAKQLFASAAFRDTLDGAMAEEYGPLSRKAEKELKVDAP